MYHAYTLLLVVSAVFTVALLWLTTASAHGFALRTHARESAARQRTGRQRPDVTRKQRRRPRDRGPHALVARFARLALALGIGSVLALAPLGASTAHAAACSPDTPVVGIGGPAITLPSSCPLNSSAITVDKGGLSGSTNTDINIPSSSTDTSNFIQAITTNNSSDSSGLANLVQNVAQQAIQSAQNQSQNQAQDQSQNQAQNRSQSQDQSQSQSQDQSQSQSQNQAQSQAQNQSQDQSQSQAQTQDQSQNQAETQAQNQSQDQSQSQAQTHDQNQSQAQPADVPPSAVPPVDLPPITLPQNCQLTEAEQQQLLDEAMAQHAANEALYQQLLLKALLDQAALKAGSAMLTQQLSGHSGLSPQDVADLIKNGTVNPADMAMAALQAASELDQETGGHTSQSTTCDQGGGPAQGLPPDNGSPSHNNSASNSSGQNQQGQGQGGQQGQQGSGRVDTPVPGLYQNIDPHDTDPFPGWHFETVGPVENIDPKTGKITYEYTTEVTYTNPAGGPPTHGYVIRQYDPATNTLIMEEANTRPVDSQWVPTNPAMVTGRLDKSTGASLPDGTPLERYMTMSQMKLIEEKFGPVFDGDYTIKMSTIFNDNTVLKLHQIDPQLADVNNSIRQTQSFGYASDSAVQRGGTVTDVTVDLSHKAEMPAKNIVGAMDGGASPAQINAMLNKYGITDPNTPVTYWFDIYLKVHGGKAP